MDPAPALPVAVFLLYDPCDPLITIPSKFIAHKIPDLLSNSRLFKKIGGSGCVAGRRSGRTNSVRDR